MRNHVPSVLGAVLTTVLLAEAPVQAYLDPGSTYLVMQGIVGGIAAALVLFKSKWRRVRSLLGRSRDGTPGR
jgi:hypothetical protein